MSKPLPVGIDLGTTYSAVARLDDAGRSIMVRNAEGELLTPSVVLFDDDEVVVGKEAKKMVGLQPDRVAECVKREMGSSKFSQRIRGEYLPPEVIQACILRKLKADALVAVGADIQVVITVPAYFDEPRRQATADAGEMAGLKVLDIVNEPTAAALAFGEQLGYLDPTGSPKRGINVLVYDLGGGTFDVTVIELQPGVFRTLATDGDVCLGGRDWDTRLSTYIADEFTRVHDIDPRQDAAMAQRVMRLAEEAKHTLTARDRANVHLEYAGRSADIELSRREFADMTADLLERTAHTSREVLRASGVEWTDISYILLVGGSTRMPMVSEMLEMLSGVRPEHGVNADEAVARGAAVYAGYLIKSRGPGGAKFTVTDVNSHSLGIAGLDPQTMRRENITIIGRNSPLPCRKTSQFVTKSENQASVVVQVLEGESKLPDQCTKIARAVMRDLPKGLAKGWPIEVTYEYQTNGRLSVTARIPGTSRDLRIDLERESSLSAGQRDRWKTVVTGEKGFDAFSSLLDEVLDMDGGGSPAPGSGAQKSGNPTATKSKLPPFDPQMDHRLAQQAAQAAANSPNARPGSPRPLTGGSPVANTSQNKAAAARSELARQMAETMGDPIDFGNPIDEPANPAAMAPQPPSAAAAVPQAVVSKVAVPPVAKPTVAKPTGVVPTAVPRPPAAAATAVVPSAAVPSAAVPIAVAGTMPAAGAVPTTPVARPIAPSAGVPTAGVPTTGVPTTAIPTVTVPTATKPAAGGPPATPPGVLSVKPMPGVVRPPAAPNLPQVRVAPAGRIPLSEPIDVSPAQPAAQVSPSNLPPASRPPAAAVPLTVRPSAGGGSTGDSSMFEPDIELEDREVGQHVADQQVEHAAAQGHFEQQAELPPAKVRRRRSIFRMGSIVNLVAVLAAPVIGIGIGFYVLQKIAPNSQVLDVLPGPVRQILIDLPPASPPAPVVPATGVPGPAAVPAAAGVPAAGVPPGQPTAGNPAVAPSPRA